MNFEETLKRLIDARLEFVIIGGFAAFAQGVTILTEDLDICIRFDKDSLERLARALEGLDPKHRIPPQRPDFVLTEHNWSDFKNLYLQLRVGVLDCLGQVKGIGGYEEVFAVSEEVTLPLGKCRMLTIPALIRAKEAIARPKDLLTAQQLRIIQKKRENP